MSQAPFFSVIIPTRDRPDLFEKAVTSVLAQSCLDREVIVIDDGSSAENRDKMDVLKSRWDQAVRWHHLPRRSRGHGHPYARNTGAELMRGLYWCTLDDDDVWVDETYLDRAKASIEAAGLVDAYFAQQRAVLNGKPVNRAIWLEPLADLLQGDTSITADSQGAYRVTVTDLLRVQSFSHLNTFIIRKALYERIGGMDEGMRYEPDRDLYLRVIDAAGPMLYHPAIVSEHRVPDPEAKKNVSTQSSWVTKRQFQLYSLNKILVSAEQKEIKSFCKRNIGHTLKHIAELKATERAYGEALFFARLGFMARPTLGWAIQILKFLIQSVSKSEQTDRRHDNGRDRPRPTSS